MKISFERIKLPVKISQNDIFCAMMPVSSYELSQVNLVSADEISTFVTQKRRNEHLSGRKLLSDVLQYLGYDVSLLEVRRNQYRAPSLAYIQGVWKREQLPAISICHSNDYAFVAVISFGQTIGIDAEPEGRTIASNVFDMMSSEDELDYLNNNPQEAIRFWTSKEAVQKSLRTGMHTNPRKIKIPIGERITNISIENSNFQLANFNFNGYNISVSFGKGIGYDRCLEDDLLDKTRQAMKSQEWSVGCNTTRNNV